MTASLKQHRTPRNTVQCALHFHLTSTELPGKQCNVLYTSIFPVQNSQKNSAMCFTLPSSQHRTPRKTVQCALHFHLPSTELPGKQCNVLLHFHLPSTELPRKQCNVLYTFTFPAQNSQENSAMCFTLPLFQHGTPVMNLGKKFPSGHAAHCPRVATLVKIKLFCARWQQCIVSLCLGELGWLEEFHQALFTLAWIFLAARIFFSQV